MDALTQALSFLPVRIASAVAAFSQRASVHEIRLRAGMPLSVTSFGHNRLLDARGRVCTVSSALRATGAEIRETVLRLCEGSVYRHAQTLREGYLVTGLGVRAGISGECVRDGTGKVRKSIQDFTGINLRIPSAVPGAADALLRAYRFSGVTSVLVYSPPGAGKTTLLRDLALRLSRGEAGEPMRVCVIDERGELFPKESAFLADAGLVDVLSGVGKTEGISTAVRLFNPQMIVCDELGEGFDPELLLSAANSGVLFAASVHAAKREELFRKSPLAVLLHGGLFSCLCGITPSPAAGCAPEVRVEEYP